MAKKLIEVSLPLEAINVASAREKSIRHGHPSTLHLWWSRKPTATARAVLFAQLVDDPSAHPDLFPTEDSQHQERERLFRIIEDLVKWENTTNKVVLETAKAEIERSWKLTCKEFSQHERSAELFDPEVLPAFHDPFAGGGAIPLEAQRLGLSSYASDLNPVAVLINKAMIEIPPKFSNRPPVNPSASNYDGNRNHQGTVSAKYNGAAGLAMDVSYYGLLMREEAAKRIVNFYPNIHITAEMVKERPDLKEYLNTDLTPIAYLWTRTVHSPNPAFADIEVPLVSSFALSTKTKKEAWADPVIRDDKSGYDFVVRVGGKPRIEGTVKRSGGGTCLMSGSPMPFEYLRKEGIEGRMGSRLMAIVCEGNRGRVYLSPTQEVEDLAKKAKPAWKPELDLPHNTRDFKTPLYGMNSFADLFTPRQLLALTTFSDLVAEMIKEIEKDAQAAGMSSDSVGLADGGTGARAYAEAVGVYLGFVIDKCADYWSSICTWHNSKELIRNTFGRQAIPMNWDYAETNPFSSSSGNWMAMVDWAWKAIESTPGQASGSAEQQSSQTQAISTNKIISTDPPYYDNIGYADLSDFFYTWLRHSLGNIYPELFATLAVPKAEELVATPYRHGSKGAAEAFFMEGMTQALSQLSKLAHPGIPVTIYYAFKQSESDDETGTSSTGWETFLEAVVKAGFEITGTWPMRTELSNRMVGRDTNALASSIVLVCRQKAKDAPAATRRDFISALSAEFPKSFARLQETNIAPVDLAQAAIGPGMAIYTSYSRVLNADGDNVGVKEALSLINQTLDEVLSAQEGDFDADTRWAIAWFDQFGFEPADYGIAETLSKAKNTSVQGLVDGGVVEAHQGKVRLLRPTELQPDWNPAADKRLSAWEALHQLIRAHKQSETDAAALAARIGRTSEAATELAYRLYVVSERRSRAADALTYNAFVQSWPEISRLARRINSGPISTTQGLFS